jgi:S1-C subfamily serine protease
VILIASVFGPVISEIYSNNLGIDSSVELPEALKSDDMIYADFQLNQSQTPGTPYSSLADAHEATYKTFVEINTSSEKDGSLGAGSGVIISKMKNGIGYYIVTNNHVVEGATKITVKLHDGTTYTAATTVLRDELTDLAVISIAETKELPVAKLGKSANLRVGENIYVIGNPLGTLAGTLTNGIISSTAQELYIDNHYMELIQTNAQINPGNSGGPMFNMAGELVAIVNAKYAGVGIEGIGFAIPIDKAVNIVTQMITKGYVEGRHNLGITTEHNLYGVGGLWISSIEKDSALIKAGMPYKSTYVYMIHAINGKEYINGPKANAYIDEQLIAGDNVSITVTVFEMTFSDLVPIEQKTYNVTLAQKYANE